MNFKIYLSNYKIQIVPLSKNYQMKRRKIRKLNYQSKDYYCYNNFQKINKNKYKKLRKDLSILRNKKSIFKDKSKKINLKFNTRKNLKLYTI